MSPKQFPSIFMDEVPAIANRRNEANWLWEGFIARRNLSLLTSLWKAGKTTLLAGLLQQMEKGGEFLGQKCNSARAMIISEESPVHWAPRLALMPIGRHVQLMARPFVRRPTPEIWLQLIGEVEEQCATGDLDFVVVDSLAAFLPAGHENDAGLLLNMLQPLQRIASVGAAVLILHHPRKQSSEEGHSARGSGALLAFVDIIMELHRYGRLKTDDPKRRIVALSRYINTPRNLVYEWNRENGAFGEVYDVHDSRFRENWHMVRAILAKRSEAATSQELLADWPSNQTAPTTCVMYEWLNRAFDMKFVRRQGQGRRGNPYRYRLPNEDDEYRDRGELPPLKDLSFARASLGIAPARKRKKRKKKTALGVVERLENTSHVE